MLINTEQDRRRGFRFIPGEEQTYRIYTDGRKQEGVLTDASRYGMGFRMRNAVKNNVDYDLEINSLHSYKNIACRARIVWVKRDESSDQYLCGARIMDMASADKMDLLDTLYQDWKKKGQPSIL